jgi:alpha-tubulin suppressor-like RCC1 family protein
MFVMVAACGDDPGSNAGGGSGSDCIPFQIESGHAVCLQASPTGDPSRRIADDVSARIAPGAQPPAVDHWVDYLHDCLEVHDQGQTGWCTANAATAAMEGLHCSPAGHHKSTRISEPHLWWLGHGKTDFTTVAEGNTLAASMIVAISHDTFLLDARLWPELAPYALPDGDAQNTNLMNNSRPPDTVLMLDGVHGADGFVPLDGLSSIKNAIASGYEVTTAMATLRGAGWDTPSSQPGAGEIFDPAPGTPEYKCMCNAKGCTDPQCNEGNHAVTLIGYDDATRKFLMLNSWGKVGLDVDHDGVPDGLYHVTYDYLTRYAYDANRYDQTRDRPPRFSQLSATGALTCGIGTNKVTYCWGQGQHYQTVVHPNNPGSDVDLRWTGEASFDDICYDDHSVGVDMNGNVSSDAHMRFLCSRSPKPEPTPVPLVTVASGAFYACGLDDTGVAYCWGDNEGGQLGIGFTSPYPPYSPTPFSGTLNTGFAHPHQVLTDRRFASIYAYSSLTCALDVGGHASCWGVDSHGEGAFSSTGNHTEPVDVALGFAFTSLSLSTYQTCGVTTANNVYCWGLHPRGATACVDGANNLVRCTNVPLPIAGTDTYRQVVTDGTKLTLLSTSGAITQTSSLDVTPVPVPGLPTTLPFVALAGGSYATCAIDTAGGLYCWGSAALGVLGNGSFSDPGPSKVVLPEPVTAVTSGWANTCALTQSGRAYCWGDNMFGEVGAEVGTMCPLDPTNPFWKPYISLQCATNPVEVSGL